MPASDIRVDYLNWMIDLVCEKRFSKSISYVKLLSYLHSVEFTYSIPKDSNRAEDGIDLRYRYAYDLLDDPRTELGDSCTVLEMILALALRCEETIMDDPGLGDRTGYWFWKMIVNLGLGGMNDDIFDEYYVEKAVSRFLNREYEPDGRGGLFTIRHCPYDLRKLEIWTQLLWFLDSIT